MSHRTRSAEPQTCDCRRAQHTHGTRLMYAKHSCGCAPCTAANTQHSKGHTARQRSEAAAAAAGAPAPTRGLFVATFPYYGGYTRPHLERVLRPAVAALAEKQDVQLLPGDLRVRLDRTGAGVFVVVGVPAVSARPPAEVRERAAVLADEHEQAHPVLARWIHKHLEVAA